MAPYTRPEVIYTAEGGGTVSTCTACGWLRWTETRQEGEQHAGKHQCRKDDPCLICGGHSGRVRIGGVGCPHYDHEARKGKR